MKNTDKTVDKTREMGVDWWTTSPYLNAKLAEKQPQTEDLIARISRLERCDSGRSVSAHTPTY
ncbi:MAG: hypothetical protein WCG50_17210 [Rhodoferax sp.]|uniref:hypothetical protein n=1 Tax=Rhodoferax sp. TaxID=50421 RepID=UPI003017DD7A